jgi:hypothetical protein
MRRVLGQYDCGSLRVRHTAWECDEALSRVTALAKELLDSELESVRATAPVETVAFGVVGEMVVVGCGWTARCIGGTNVGGR